MISNPFDKVKAAELELASANKDLKKRIKLFSLSPENEAKSVAEFVLDEVYFDPYVNNVVENEDYSVVTFQSSESNWKFQVYVSKSPFKDMMEPKEMWRKLVADGICLEGFQDWSKKSKITKFRTFSVTIDKIEYFIGIYEE